MHNIDVSKIFPYIGGIIVAAGGLYVSARKSAGESNKTQHLLTQMELEWLEKIRKEAAEIIEHRMDEVIHERDRLQDEVGKLQERVAVLESRYTALERSKHQEILKRNIIIKDLRGQVDALKYEREQLQVEITTLRLRANEK